MKNCLLIVLLLIASSAAFAQLDVPAPSPFSKVEQKVGLTDVTLEYSRPGVKGRSVFGGIVPFDAYWRTGANAVSTIEFSKAVTIADTEVPAGKYSFFTKPGNSSWEFYLYKDLTFFPNREPEPEHIAVKTKLTPQKSSDLQETFSVSLENIRDGSADLHISWEYTRISLPIAFGTEQEVQASIDRLLSGPTTQDYAAAINYTLNANGDLNQALDWANKAVAMETSFPAVMAKLNVLSAMEQKGKAASYALEMADDPKLNALDLHQIARTFMGWGDKETAYSIFSTNAKRHPDTWPINVGLARMYSSQGKFKKAIQHAEKALVNSPNEPNTQALKAAIERLKKGEDINS
ncbi:MAG: DUF2911 domain-containing protein [Bacteroidota bacterium]